MAENTAIIIFVRHPELGKVKTRLAATIGDEKALAVYEFLLEHTYKIVEHSTVPVYIYYADQIVQGDIWKGDGINKKLQRGEDLGEKMANAFREVLQQGCHRAVIIGSDCYELTVELIAQAFKMLQNADIVIGPAKDGGYYLLGMNAPFKNIFNGIEWSTDTVFTKTMDSISQNNYTFSLLTVLADVDTADDISFTY